MFIFFLVIFWFGFNVLRILVFGFRGFMRLGKNKLFICNYFFSGIIYFGFRVLGLRFGSRLMEYDLEFLREIEFSDFRIDGIF